MSDTDTIIADIVPPGDDLTPMRIPEGDPPEDYVALAKDYPVAIIAGGLAIGLLAGALLPRGFGRNFARNAIGAAMTAGELGRNYSRQVIDITGDTTQESRKKLGSLGDVVSELGSRAGQHVQNGRSLGHKFAREAIRIVVNLKR